MGTVKIPMTPPDGLLDRAAEIMDDAHVLLMEPVWIEEGGIAPVLEERRPRKERWVRLGCSACGRSIHVPYLAHVDRLGYGYLDEDQGQPVGSHDDAICPICGAEARVYRAAELGRVGWRAAASCSMMSADVIDGHLVLTAWWVERRVHRDFREELKALPCEAYDFTAEGCRKFSAWRTTYSGTAGYYKTWTPYWTSPKEWRETWGAETEIFGLTPELIARSPLPNCKLDLYMQERIVERRYPVAYLRLYQRHPQVENLLVSGLPLVLDDLLLFECSSVNWDRSNRFGVPKLDEIDWTEARPSKMLGLTRDELARGRHGGWNAYFWRLYVGAKAHGEILSDETLRTIFELGDECVTELLGEAPITKIVRYLAKQYEVQDEYALEWEDEMGDPPDWGIADSTELRDYWQTCRRLGRDLDDDQVRWPYDLPQAHDEASAELREWNEEQKTRTLHKAFAARAKMLEDFSFELDGLTIYLAPTPEALRDEGTQQHHCVWSYADRHAMGDTAIFLIRKTAAPEISYFTLELDERELKVLQNRGLRNRDRTPEVERFEALWLAWLRLGRPRNADGTPAVEVETKTA